MITIIAAISKNGVIGIENQLPWHIPADFKHFKETTLHGTVIMGRKTFDSIGKPLPNRTNIVITRNKGLIIPGCITVNSLKSAIRKAGSNTEIFIIGGEEVYKMAMPIADCLNLTIIKESFEGDAFFPKISRSEWDKISSEDYQADEKNKFPYSFIKYERRKNNYSDEWLGTHSGVHVFF